MRIREYRLPCPGIRAANNVQTQLQNLAKRELIGGVPTPGEVQSNPYLNMLTLRTINLCSAIWHLVNGQRAEAILLIFEDDLERALVDRFVQSSLQKA